MVRTTREDDPTAPLLQGGEHGYEATGPTASPAQGNSVPIGTSSPDRLPEKWNQPKIKAWRVLATFYSFIVVGANDGAYGALIHYLGSYYNADYAVVSVVFLSQFLGYATAALTNNSIHKRFGQRGIAWVGPGTHILAYLGATQHPPYPVLIALFMLAGLGSGLVDASWNAWIGAMPNSSQLMGVLHAFYGLGAALAPLIATWLMTQRGWQWYEFYYLMAPAAAMELATSVAAFWSATGSAHELEALDDPSDEGAVGEDGTIAGARKSPTIEALGLGSTWIVSFFLFVYVGVEVSMGGWIFTFLVDLRHTTPFSAGIVTFTYWGGLTVGRVWLAFLTSCFKTQRMAVLVYLVASVVLHLIFCFVDDFLMSAISVSLLGFFLGPLYPEAVIAQAKILPRYLHLAAVGFACALGSAGGCVFPFVTGFIARTYGIHVLQPAVLVMLVLCLGLWIALPSGPRMS
ncbi:MFS transporter [Aspergillus steynii IBT 23096]|uniref:MFS transporter n=1 Tax=Aspergillus steynii IBT 23096 TaxID=1392250 RepID=A0A2I2G0F3_9EURO|nr:MFS transporter [Aspergillus steynii IBT 23096]PLB46362.1 MFS transporter [Aspergillus steynii IBT 23096]